MAERNEEIARLQTQIEERERVLPLRERIKEIFKKHGVTLTAILLAVGVTITIGSVIGAITKTLKATGKSLGNGLKEIGKKTASLLPGLLSSIVSFLFKAAGQAIGFLAEHMWLLIGQQALPLPLFEPPPFFRLLQHCESGLTDGCLAGLFLIFPLPCVEGPLFYALYVSRVNKLPSIIPHPLINC